MEAQVASVVCCVWGGLARVGLCGLFGCLKPRAEAHSLGVPQRGHSSSFCSSESGVGSLMQRDRLRLPFSSDILGCRKQPLHFHKVDPATLLGFLSSLLCTEVRDFFVVCLFIAFTYVTCKSSLVLACHPVLITTPTSQI